MKDISIIRYYNEYTWLRIEHQMVSIGISKFAAQQWGRILAVQLPFLGKFCREGEVFGVVESVHTTEQLLMPIDGLVLKTNARLETEPELLNNEPMGQGWLLQIKYTSPEQLDALLTEKAYEHLIRL